MSKFEREIKFDCRYMSVVEGCGTYGMDFYEVRDKSQTAWSLGISSKGLSQFPANGPRIKPKRVSQPFND